MSIETFPASGGGGTDWSKLTPNFKRYFAHVTATKGATLSVLNIQGKGIVTGLKLRKDITNQDIGFVLNIDGVDYVLENDTLSTTTFYGIHEQSYYHPSESTTHFYMMKEVPGIIKFDSNVGIKLKNITTVDRGAHVNIEMTYNTY